MLLALICGLVGVFYIYYWWSFGFWKRRGIPGPTPLPIVGNMLDTILQKRHFVEIYDDIYNRFKNHSYVGMYRMGTPAILLRDPDIIKNVLVRDFDSFHDNDFKVDEKADPLISRNSFVVAGSKWKANRGQISSLYTASKVKSMFPLMLNTSNKLITYLTEMQAESVAIGLDVKEVAAKFTTENVATCAFGLEGKCFTENSYFRDIGRKIFQVSTWMGIKLFILMVMPWLTPILKITFVSPEVDKSIRQIVRDTKQLREDPKQQKDDLFQALLKMQKTLGEDVFTNDDLGGHSLTFYSEGFETSSTLLSFALYELALNPDIQNRLYNEVKGPLSNLDEITHEVIQNLPYLNGVIQESLRKYPPAIAFHRLCTKPYVLKPEQSGCNSKTVSLDVGTCAIIPVYSLHRDPEHFPNPEKFDPDRFNEENKNSFHKFAYLPFGEGPRICLGTRFGLGQTKLGLAMVVKHFKISLHQKTPRHLEFEPTAFLYHVKNILYLTFEKRN